MGETDVPSREIPCPRCQERPSLLPGFGALHEDVCPVCAGRFLPPEGVDRVVVDEHGVSRATLRELVAMFASRERLPCPRCASRMSPVQVRGVRIDLCTGCGGAWLDAGELAKLGEGRHEELRPTAVSVPVPAPVAAPPAEGPHVAAVEDRVAVFFATLDPPSSSTLSAVFAKIQGLTAMDGAIVARRNDGVAADNVPHATGETIVKALRDEGIAAAVADVSWTALPLASSSNSVQPGDTLRFGGGDAWNSHDIPWHHVVAMAAGEVPREGIRRVQTGAGVGVTSTAPEGDMKYQAFTADDAFLDVILVEPPRRVRVSRSMILLGESARGRDRNVVFTERIAEVARGAPASCALGRGVRASQDGGRLPRYRTLLELEHEEAWLLWRFHGPGRDL